jgi:hypothetical protein
LGGTELSHPEKQVRRAINAAGGNVLVGGASGGSISAPDSALEDLEELKAWLRGLKPSFENCLPNFEQHGCVSMHMVRELTDEKFRTLIQTPDTMKGLHLKRLEIAINAAGGTISDGFSASSDDIIPVAEVVDEGGGGGATQSSGSACVPVTKISSSAKHQNNPPQTGRGSGGGGRGGGRRGGSDGDTGRGGRSGRGGQLDSRRDANIAKKVAELMKTCEVLCTSKLENRASLNRALKIARELKTLVLSMTTQTAIEFYRGFVQKYSNQIIQHPARFRLLSSATAALLYYFVKHVEENAKQLNAVMVNHCFRGEHEGAMDGKQVQPKPSVQHLVRLLQLRGEHSHRGESSDIDDILRLLDRCWEFAADKDSQASRLKFRPAFILKPGLNSVLMEMTLQPLRVATTTPGGILDISLLENSSQDDTELPEDCAPLQVTWSDQCRDTNVHEVIGQRITSRSLVKKLLIFNIESFSDSLQSVIEKSSGRFPATVLSSRSSKLDETTLRFGSLFKEIISGSHEDVARKMLQAWRNTNPTAEIVFSLLDCLILNDEIAQSDRSRIWSCTSIAEILVTDFLPTAACFSSEYLLTVVARGCDTLVQQEGVAESTKLRFLVNLLSQMIETFAVDQAGQRGRIMEGHRADVTRKFPPAVLRVVLEVANESRGAEGAEQRDQWGSISTILASLGSPAPLQTGLELASKSFSDWGWCLVDPTLLKLMTPSALDAFSHTQKSLIHLGTLLLSSEARVTPDVTLGLIQLLNNAVTKPGSQPAVRAWFKEERSEEHHHTWFDSILGSLTNLARLPEDDSQALVYAASLDGDFAAVEAIKTIVRISCLRKIPRKYLRPFVAGLQHAILPLARSGASIKDIESLLHFLVQVQNEHLDCDELPQVVRQIITLHEDLDADEEVPVVDAVQALLNSLRKGNATSRVLLQHAKSSLGHAIELLNCKKFEKVLV